MKKDILYEVCKIGENGNYEYICALCNLADAKHDMKVYVNRTKKWGEYVISKIVNNEIVQTRYYNL